MENKFARLVISHILIYGKLSSYYARTRPARRSL